MISPIGRGSDFPWKTLALTLAIWAFSRPTANVYGWGREPYGVGYSGYGQGPGPIGFGLKYHPGYGYGGNSVGVGAGGGYPFYGGPGYPHEAPGLRRFGRELPFPYYGGPGAPSCDYPTVFGPVGPLVVDPPVVRVGDRGDLSNATDFGPLTGALPYPEAVFAPNTAEAAATGTGREGR
jgi:hypothetical protein